MKSTGIVRKVDDLGRIVIPKETRKALCIDIGDPLEVFVQNDAIILKPYHAADEMMDLTHRINARLRDVKSDELRSAIYEKIGELKALIEEDKL